MGSRRSSWPSRLPAAQGAEKGEEALTPPKLSPSRGRRSSSAMAEIWPENRCAASPVADELSNQKYQWSSCLAMPKDQQGRARKKLEVATSKDAAWRKSAAPDPEPSPASTWSRFLQTRRALHDTHENHVLLDCNAKLHKAAARGDAKACRVLLLGGADPGAKDRNGVTALHFAAGAGHLQACELLLKFGTATTAERDNAGDTALQRAAKGRHVEVCKLLRERAELVAQRTADMNAKMCRAAGQGNYEQCCRLLERGAEAGAEDRQGVSALHRAVFGGHVGVSMLLLDAGAEVSALDRIYGGSALHRAAHAGHSELCAKLLDRGAEVNSEDNGGRTALHHAASGGHKEVCAVLFGRGAELDSATALLLEQSPTKEVLAEPRPLKKRPPKLDTDLDELECDRISQSMNRNPLPGHVFPPEVRPAKGSRCFRR